MDSINDFIDLHVHADNRSGEDFPRLRTAGCTGLLAVSGPGAGFRSLDSLLDHFRRLHHLDRRRIEAAGLRAWVAIGVHPAGIPERDLDRFLDDWPGLCGRYDAAAIGEVGLEQGTEVECRILSRALEVAAETGLPVVVHTPRQNKAAMVERSLQLLASTALSPAQVVLDHLDEDTLELARDSGCWMGLSVHPQKLDPGRAAAIIGRHGPERMIVNSDMGAAPSHLFAIPATRSALLEAGLDREQLRQVLYEHPLRILGAAS